MTDSDDTADLAPRPRPGFKSRPAPATFSTPRLFAASLRALLGAVGVFGSLLYLPIQIATPVLSGVSLLMMVSGCTNAWGAVREAPPAVRRIPLALTTLCAVALAATVGLTLVLGAGSLGPVAAARAEAAREAAEAPPTVTFEPPPSR